MKTRPTPVATVADVATAATVDVTTQKKRDMVATNTAASAKVTVEDYDATNTTASAKVAVEAGRVCDREAGRVCNREAGESAKEKAAGTLTGPATLFGRRGAKTAPVTDADG